MYESPRLRRLRNDLAALRRLSSESSIFHFEAAGNPPQQYQITFKGKGLCRDRGKIKIAHLHRVEIKLGSSYPRTVPELRWLTPVYHPNISEIGMVCLGGYGTHWVPSVQLDELCMMLWDMARYHNYDIRSPYNRDAALWVANQTAILFPTDHRSLRDLRVAQGRVESTSGNGMLSGFARGSSTGAEHSPRRGLFGTVLSPAGPITLERVRRFMEGYGRARPENGSGNTELARLATPVVPLPAETDQVPPPAPATTTEMARNPDEVEPRPAAADLLILDEECQTLATTLPRPASASEEILFIE